MSGNVHPNHGPIFPCSVCTGNVIWRGKPLQSSATFIPTLVPSFPTPPTRIPTLRNLAPPLLMLHSHPTLVSKPLIPHLPIIYLLPLPPHHRPSLLAILLHFLSSLPPPPDSFRVLQWNAGGLRARSTELLHFLSSNPVDLICIQESNLNSSSSFRIPGFSALRSDRTHSRSGILSSDTTHASSSVVIFVKQGLSFSELSTSSLSSLDPYSNYVGTNLSVNNSSSLSFLNVYAPLFAPLQRIAEPTPFLPPLSLRLHYWSCIFGCTIHAFLVNYSQA